MNHVLENGLIVAVLLIIVFTPIYLAVRNSRNLKKKKISDGLIQAEKDFGANFQQIDHLDSSVIAMDKDKKLIVQLDINDYTSHMIDLKNIASCTIEEKKKGRATQLLQLVLRNSSNQALHHIILYKQYIDNEWHLEKSGKTAAHWEVMINRAISMQA